MSSPNATPANSAPDPAPSCPRCGRAIPAAAPLGTCPHCLFAAGLPSILGAPSPDNAPQPSPTELSPEFPSLDILELLGRGGMGAVYKARQRDLGRLVALKILRPGLDASPGFAERFTREARALARLNHPGIVTLYEFGHTPAGRYFILMEFVDGVNLRGLLAAGRLAPREALAIVPPLCDALQYAHDGGLVHRDIKPENILVDRLGRVKIADFGIARLAAADGASMTTETEVAGTPAYMAPEQKDRPGAVDHRADLYALGVVLYQMLTGELPAPGQLQPPSSRVQIDVRLDAIVLRALAKDPALRYAAASEFKTHVETVTTTSAGAAPASSSSATGAASPSSAAPRPLAPHSLALAYYGFSYRSRRTLFGLPLLHIAVGVDPTTGRRRIARGIVAIGDIAQGVFALGGVAMGGVTFGGISLGVFSYGGLVLALLAFGGLGIGAIAAFAGLAIAPLALGGFALGWYAFGGSAWGIHASSPVRHDPEAIAFFGPWAREFTQVASMTTLAMIIFGFAIMFSAIEWARRRAVRAASQSTPGARLSPWPLLALLVAITLAILSLAIPLFLRASARAESASKQAAWNLDVVVTDHRAWPPQTLPSVRVLPVAGAALALLGSCDTREPTTPENWRAVARSPHLRLDYPRAAEGNMPDAILLPLPFTSATSLWTRKGGKITRHSAFASDKAEEMRRVYDTTTPPSPRHRFGGTRAIDLPRARSTAYDFDQERFIDYVRSVRWPNGIEASQDWHAEQGTDVIADPDSHRPGVLFLGTDLVEVSPEVWDSTADHAVSFSGQPNDGLMVFVPAPRSGQPRPTYVYRTPQGGIMLIQILGANDAADVSLRYKEILPIAAEPLHIEITNEGSLSIEGKAIDPLQLSPPLRRHSDANAQAAVQLATHPQTKVAAIEAIMQACAKAGIQNIAMHTPDQQRASAAAGP